jgi:hypoxanthine phosphoribosyltransferase
VTDTSPSEAVAEEVVLFTAEQIAEKVQELADRISGDYRRSSGLVLVGVLKGGAVFLCDLIRAIEAEPEVDFIWVSSYGDSKASSGRVEILSDVGASLENKDVVVVDCVVDSGLTMGRLHAHLSSKPGVNSVEVCALLSKGAGARPKYLGFEIEDEFVVGYGLDLAEKYRNLPYIAALR